MKMLIATLMLATVLISCSESTATTNSASQVQKNRQAGNYVIALATNLSEESRAKVKSQVLSLLENSVHGDEFFIMDATSLKTVCKFKVERQTRSSKTTNGFVRQYAKEFKALLEFFKAKPTNEKGLCWTEVFSKLSRQVNAQKKTQILLVGSPMYRSSQRGFNLAESKKLVYPEDSFLTCEDVQRSPWTTVNKTSLNNMVVHWVFPEFTFRSESESYYIERFNHLYLKLLDAKLASFTNDLEEGINNFLTGKESVREFHLSSDAEKNKSNPMLVAIPANNNDIDWLIRKTPEPVKVESTQVVEPNSVQEEVVPLEPHAPVIPQVGSCKIGIVWGAKYADNDLYVSLNDKPFVYYANRKEGFATYYKDIRAQIGDSQYEMITLLKPLNIHTDKLKVRVNHYAGLIPEGEENNFTVKVMYAGQVYEASYKLPSSRGTP